MMFSRFWLRRGGLLLFAATLAGIGHGADASTATVRRMVAFPGAEGFGRFAQGGRGGDAYHVTNLDDDGPGSLRHGIRSAVGPRTIVFDVAGNLPLASPLVVDKSRLTLAGQTAPGDGITLRNHTLVFRDVSDVIVRHLRIRVGDEFTKLEPRNAIVVERVDHMILDHVSASWGIDGISDVHGAGNFTLQWCVLAEPLARGLLPAGTSAVGALFRDLTGDISIHHTLFATSTGSLPVLGTSRSSAPGRLIDFRNNVIYNAAGTTVLGNHFVNAVNNVWRPGPESPRGARPMVVRAEASRGQLSGNRFDGSEAWTHDNATALDFLAGEDADRARRALARWKGPATLTAADTPQTQSAAEAMERVLAGAGMSIARDVVDRRLVSDVRAGKGRVITSTREVGGWPRLRSLPASKDSDGDGMPDAWEVMRRLDPQNAEDRNGDDDGDGFTNLEAYLHERAQRVATATFKPAYPPSPVIAGVRFDDATARTEAEGSDIWPITWAANDQLFTAWGDGGGFGGSNQVARVKLGVARIDGGKRDYRGVNLAGGKGAPRPAAFEGKSEGILALGNTLYLWRDNDRAPGVPEYFQYFDLWRSDDLGSTWQKTGVEFATRAHGDYPAGDRGMFAPAFCQFGRGYAGARDEFVYIYAPDVIDPSHWNVRLPGRINLLRVPRARIESKEAYEVFAGFGSNGEPQWARGLGARQPVWRDETQGTHRIAVSYNVGLRRYLLTTITIDRSGWMSIYDAPEPWGPWTHVFTEHNPDRWGALTITFTFVNKWLSADGREFVIVHTKDDRWATIEGRFDLPAANVRP